MLHTTIDERRIRLSAPTDVVAMSPADRASAPSREASADYDVRRLLAPDGHWHEFLVLSAWTSMQATVWLNRQPRR
ncbi:hypothetical protein FHR70_004034 [Microvirga lupini]|uniref:Uncharacterized protein n=1 Tax=Microvirga lupini TaxID=420324 RepID=A0A7W4YYA3_9HYPH|nr:hypothetical protein [Microvirga lupini]MBB3020946.1 hypothetical protein [Microvirga lupini]